MQFLRRRASYIRENSFRTLSEEEWVLIEGVQLKKMYSGALQQLANISGIRRIRRNTETLRTGMRHVSV